MEYVKSRGWPTDLAKKAYDDGYFAEAIQTLHGWIESQCREMLKLVGSEHFKTKLSDTWDMTDEISLVNIIKILFVLGQITKEEYEGLLELNSMRNKIIHQMFKDPYEKEFKGISKEEYDKVFSKSLGSSELLQEKMNKLFDG